MRIAVVTESFLPTTNGVTNSVTKVLDHLSRTGHQAMVIVPAAGSPREYNGFPVHEVPALALRQFQMGLPSGQVQRVLGRFRPDVLHAASPFLLGGQAIAAAGRLGIPSVAIFQTDVAGYARRNRVGAATGLVWRMVRRIHEGADLTLVPSSASMADLERAGVERLGRWGRGVDLVRYHPSTRLDAATTALRARLAPGGETIVGYVGRIAPEKQVERFAALRGVRGIRIALVGDGPATPAVARALAGMPVTWLGRLSGRELAVAYASFDVFLHTGSDETFGQTLQESFASGVPVVAPRSGGPIDLVQHGSNGFLFEPGDDAGLRYWVELLVREPTMRARMGEAGRRSVLGRSWESVCAELVAHYERVVRAASVARTPAPAATVSRSR